MSISSKMFIFKLLKMLTVCIFYERLVDKFRKILFQNSAAAYTSIFLVYEKITIKKSIKAKPTIQYYFFVKYGVRVFNY